MVESAQQEFRVSEAEFDGERLVPETQQILQRLFEMHRVLNADQAG
jgi:hypothetical protein